MSQIIKTLVVDQADGAITQANILSDDSSTFIADAASAGSLIIQKNGAPQAGNASAAGAEDFLKLTVVKSQANGENAVVSSSEFQQKDIWKKSYKVSSDGSSATYELDYSNAEKVGGQLFLRLERRDGLGINDSETFSEETLAKLKTRFDNRKTANMTEFDNVSLVVDGNTLKVTVASRDLGESDVHISANEKVTFSDVNPGNKLGSRKQAEALEKLSNISMGATNQYGFPIVVPETFTASSGDYGIATIELRKKVGGRYVYETIKVLIKDDEASESKTLKALSTILGLGFDVAAPVVTSVVVSMVTDATGDTAAGTTYSAGGETAIFVKATNLEVGTKAIITINSDDDGDAGHGHEQTFDVETAEEVFAITGIDASDFAATNEIEAVLKLRDANNNESTAVTQATAIVIQS